LDTYVYLWLALTIAQGSVFLYYFTKFGLKALLKYGRNNQEKKDDTNPSPLLHTLTVMAVPEFAMIPLMIFFGILSAMEMLIWFMIFG